MAGKQVLPGSKIRNELMSIIQQVKRRKFVRLISTVCDWGTNISIKKLFSNENSNAPYFVVCGLRNSSFGNEMRNFGISIPK